jgi:hypothetical protein
LLPLPRGDFDRGILLEDRVFELAERPPRLDPELGKERPPRRAVCLECFGLPAGAVQREHELGAQAFPQRMPRDEPFQLRHELVMVAEGELRLDSVLEDADVQFLEALDLVLGEGLVREVGQRGSTPEYEGAAKLLQCLRVVALVECGPALCDKPLEAVAVEFVGLQREGVRAGNRPDRVGRQRLP